jgi:hypothetical protein
MGSATSSNFSSTTTKVENNILNTTNSSVDQINQGSQETQIGSIALIGDCGDVNATNVASQTNQAVQYGTVANASQALTDMAQSAVQEATSEVSGFGIGAASSNNTAAMFASVTNTMQDTTSTTLAQSNALSQNFSLTDFSYDCSHNIFEPPPVLNFGNLMNQMNDADQTSDASNDNTTDTKITQTVDQTATSTVSGVNFGIFAVIGAIVVIMIIMSAMGKGGKSSSLKGGYNGSLTPNSICLLLIAALCVLLGVLSVTTRVPCNLNEQCTSKDWFNSGTCTCVDHFQCAGSGVGRKVMPDAAPPLMFLACIDNSTDRAQGTYNMMLNRASVMGWVNAPGSSANSGQTRQNNSGFNIAVYQEMYKYAMGKRGDGDAFALPLLQYMRKKVRTTAQGFASNAAAGQQHAQYIYIPKNQGTASVTPCVAEMATAVLPMEPYYLPEQYTCGYVAPEVDGDSATRNETAAGERSVTDFLQAARVPRSAQVRRRMEHRFAAQRQRQKAKQQAKQQVKQQAKQLAAHKFPNTHAPRRPTHRFGMKPGAANLVGGFCYADVGDKRMFKRLPRGETCAAPWRQMFMSAHAKAAWDDSSVVLNGATARFGGPDDQSKCYVQLAANPGADPSAVKIFGDNCSSNDSSITGISACDTATNITADHPAASGGTKTQGITFAAIDGGGGIRMVPTCHTLQDANNHTPFIATFNTATRSTIQSNPPMDQATSTDYTNIKSGAYTESISISDPAINGNALCRDALGFIDPSDMDSTDTDFGGMKLPMGPPGFYMTGIAKSGTDYTYGDVKSNQPVVSCAYSVPDAADATDADNDGNPAAFCDSNTPENCWTPALCAHHNGTWSEPGCMNDGKTDCYPTDTGAYCSDLPVGVCNVSGCGECSQDKCGKTVGCKWDADAGKCWPACEASTNNCCSCALGDCGATGTCVKTRTGRCALGMDQCVQDDTDNDDGAQGLDANDAGNPCPALSAVHYLVEIPTTFRKAGVVGGANCLPNVFVPTPDGSELYYSAAPLTNRPVNGDSTGVWVDCSSAATGSIAGTNSVNNYTADCAYPVDNEYGATGCYGGTDATCASDQATYQWQVLGIADSARCHDFGVSQTLQAANFCAIPTNEFSCWSMAQGNDTYGKALYSMFVRIFQWLCLYHGSTSKTEYALSTLGASTLMNPWGLDSETGLPTYELNTVADVATMVDVNDWAKVQPLLLKTAATGEYMWLTLEDMYNQFDAVELQGYLGQISMFVYSPDAEGTSYNRDVSVMATEGLTNDLNAADLVSNLDNFGKDFGSLVGSYGTCTNLFNNDIFTGCTFGTAVVLILIVIALTLAKNKNA